MGIIGEKVRPLLEAAVADPGLKKWYLRQETVALREYVETGWSTVESARGASSVQMDRIKFGEGQLEHMRSLLARLKDISS